jgi:hypothetical protein
MTGRAALLRVVLVYIRMVWDIYGNELIPTRKWKFALASFASLSRTLVECIGYDEYILCVIC